MNSTSIDASNLRSLEETLIRSAAIHFVTAATVGHLNSLRGYPDKCSTLLLLHLIGFILIPTLPLAQLFRRVRFAIFAAYQRRLTVGSLTYYASACLGIHAQAPEQEGCSVPIVNIELSELQQRRERYNMVWLGRMIVLLALIVQYCGTILLWIRRMHSGNAVWQIDTRNLEMVLGGFSATIMSIAISLLNTTWTIANQSSNFRVELEARRYELSSSSDIDQTRLFPPGLRTSATNNASQPQVNSSDALPSLSRSPRSTRLSTYLATVMDFSQNAVFRLVHKCKMFIYVSMGIVRFYSTIKSFNSRMSDKILPFYPLELQWDLEMAHVIRIFFWFSADLRCMAIPIPGVIWRNEPVKAWSYFQGSILNEWYLQHFKLLIAILLFPSFVILLHILLWIVAHNKLIKSIPCAVRQIFHELDFWMRSGRTVFLIVINSLMIAPTVLQVALVLRDIPLVRFGYANLDWWSEWVLWKDPLTDHLYII